MITVIIIIIIITIITIVTIITMIVICAQMCVQQSKFVVSLEKLVAVGLGKQHRSSWRPVDDKPTVTNRASDGHKLPLI